jgi:hypothetical protein
MRTNAHRESDIAEGEVNHRDSTRRTAALRTLLSGLLHGDQFMSQDRSVGIVTGLVFVALFLLMLATFHGVASHMSPPMASYELAGTSRPAK